MNPTTAAFRFECILSTAFTGKTRLSSNTIVELRVAVAFSFFSGVAIVVKIPATVVKTSSALQARGKP